MCVEHHLDKYFCLSDTDSDKFRSTAEFLCCCPGVRVDSKDIHGVSPADLARQWLRLSHPESASKVVQQMRAVALTVLGFEDVLRMYVLGPIFGFRPKRFVNLPAGCLQCIAKELPVGSNLQMSPEVHVCNTAGIKSFQMGRSGSANRGRRKGSCQKLTIGTRTTQSDVLYDFLSYLNSPSKMYDPSLLAVWEFMGVDLGSCESVAVRECPACCKMAENEKSIINK